MSEKKEDLWVENLSTDLNGRIPLSGSVSDQFFPAGYRTAQSAVMDFLIKTMPD